MLTRDFFDKIFVINLPHRKDKLRSAIKELSKLKLSPAHEKVEIFPAIRPKEAAGFQSIGVRGCFLSHLNILEIAEKTT